MNFFYAILGSSSKANSFFFKIDNISFLIDNGFSCLSLENRLKEIGHSSSSLKYIFLTHSHSDHSRGVPRLSQKYSIPVYTHKKCYIKDIYQQNSLEIGQVYDFKKFKIEIFKTFHDCEGSIGFSILINDLRFTIITDTGKISQEMEKFATISDILFLESNYDHKMLINGDYPPHLKNRIISDIGHLSNNCALDFANKISLNKNCKTKFIYLCHISENNNCKKVVEELFKNGYNGRARVLICERDKLKIGEFL